MRTDTFSNVARHKINIQKSAAFLCISKEIAEEKNHEINFT
jgi:hypothetical protein